MTATLAMRDAPLALDELPELLADIEPPRNFKVPAMERLCWHLEKVLHAPVRAVDVIAALLDDEPTAPRVAGGAGVLRQIALARGWKTLAAARRGFAPPVRYIAPPTWRPESRS